MYAIRSPYWVIRDEGDRIGRLRFHIEKGDYFPFLATIVGILSDSASDADAIRFAEDLRKDLLYLHEHYEIRPRKERLVYTTKKMVRFDP